MSINDQQGVSAAESASSGNNNVVTTEKLSAADLAVIRASLAEGDSLELISGENAEWMRYSLDFAEPLSKQASQNIRAEDDAHLVVRIRGNGMGHLIFPKNAAVKVQKVDDAYNAYSYHLYGKGADLLALMKDADFVIPAFSTDPVQFQTTLLEGENIVERGFYVLQQELTADGDTVIKLVQSSGRAQLPDLVFDDPEGETFDRPTFFTTDTLPFERLNAAGEDFDDEDEGVQANLPPVAVDDSVNVDEDSMIVIDVLANDSDPDGDKITLIKVTDPANGTAEIVEGKVKYTPDQNYNGPDEFTYTIVDSNGKEDTAVVNITVNPVDDLPVANDDAATTEEDTPITVDVLANDSDPDGPVTINDILEQPTHGTAEIVEGKIVYTPDANYFGEDKLKYQIIDEQGNKADAFVNITVTPVNDPPTGGTDPLIITLEDTTAAVKVPQLIADVEGDTVFTVDVKTQPPHGTVTSEVRPDPQNGGKDTTYLIYTPEKDYFDTDNTGQVTVVTFTDSDGGSVTLEVDLITKPVNDPPVANDDGVNTDEDTPIEIDVLANDTDVPNENNILSVESINNQPQNGTAEITADGTILYTPDANFSGLDSFTYILTDNDGGTDEATVTVNVGAVNDRPDAVNDTAATDEDTPVDIDVLANDSDPDGDVLTVNNITKQPSKGTVEITDDGKNIKYTPNPNATGDDEFLYQVSDGKGGFDIAKVTVTITPVNDKPEAKDDTAETQEDTPTDIDVLANDSDPDGDPLEIINVSDPDNGTAEITDDGKIKYTPDPDFNGTDTITYTVKDPSGETSQATVTVTVTPVNDAPVAEDDTDTTQEDTPKTVDVLANDSDPDGDPLKISGILTLPANGKAEIDSANNKIIYTPNANFNGTDTLVYSISDGKGGSDTATLTITVDPVNDAPVANDDAVSTQEDTPKEIDVLVNDIDPEGDDLEITAITADPANGAVEIKEGKIIYTPNANFNGQDTFEYRIKDENGLTDTATVTVTVGPENDAPEAADDTATTDEDTPVTIDVLANDTDVEGDPLTISGILTPPANGTAEITADGKIKYTPDENFNGTDTLVYTVTDGKDTDTATVTITVNPVNDAPAAQDDAATTEEDTPISINVLQNDSDIDGDSLSISDIGSPANGTAELVNGEILYTPNPDFNGTDSFTYTVFDGKDTDTATVTVTVTPVNDAPVANDDSITTPEDQPVSIDVLANDTDIDGDTLEIAGIDTQPANGTAEVVNDKILYTPNPDFNGTDTIIYTVSDGKGGTDTATVTVTVTPVDDEPIANDDTVTTPEDEAITIDVLANDIDIEDGKPSLNAIKTQPANGTAQIVNGQILYTPALNFNGTDTFTYEVKDSDGNLAEATVTVNVTPENDPPVAEDDTATVKEDESVTIDVLANDSDVDGDTVSITKITGEAAHGKVEIVNGEIKYTPDANYFGQDEFEYEITDGNNGFDTAKVKIDVTPVNDAPSGFVDPLLITRGDASITVGTNIFAQDPDGDQLLFTSIAQQPANGTLEIIENGTKLKFTPDSGFSGGDLGEVVISDGQFSVSTEFDLLVQGTGNTSASALNTGSLSFTPQSAEDAENDQMVIDVLEGNSDGVIDNIVTGPQNGTAAIEDNKIVYTPNDDYQGEDMITYRTVDETGDFKDIQIRFEIGADNSLNISAMDDIDIMNS